jgi:hypothetical protein
LKTASFFTYTGPGRISIARFAPRNTPAGFRIYKPLAPGPWFNSVPEDVYRELYFAQLAELDATAVMAKLHELAAGAEPVLLCYERKHDCDSGTTFCHRFMVAEWFKTELWLIVPEVESAP